MKSPRMVVACILIALLGLTQGCTNVNRPLNASDVPLEARIKNHTHASTSADVSLLQISSSVPAGSSSANQSDDANLPYDADGYFVGLALSGGGSRSANFSAACMFELQRLGLLSRVDYISSVSGGSLTGTYYCLCPDADWNPGNVQRKLTHSFANDVIVQGILPWNALALMFSDWDRSDLLAGSFEQTLFTRGGRGQTFGDLRADRPHLLINATDLQSGQRFIFCNESFDDLNSDLARFPLGTAVAASAAVPVVLHQVTLRDYSTVFKQFRHLIDGGINDNLGISTLVETYIAQTDAAEKIGRPDPYPNGAVFIVLDARTRFDAHLDDKGDIGLIESLATGASVTSSSLLNRVSSATLSNIIVKYSPDAVTAQTLRAQIAELDKEGYLVLHDRHGRNVTVVHLALSRVADLANAPSQGFFQRLNNIATYFNITDAEAASLYKAADLIVREKYEDRLKAITAALDAPTTKPVR